MPYKRKRLVGLAGATLVFGLMLSPVAFGDEDSSADAQLQELTVELKKLDVADKDNVATAELGKSEALRDKARALVGDKKQSLALTRTLEELEATVALVEAKLAKHQAKLTLAEKEKELTAKKGEVDSLTSEVDKLEEKRTELEKQLAGAK